MHEWALAEAVLESVRRETPAAAEVKAVALRLGELQAVDQEVFLAGLEELAPEYGLAAGVFSLEIEPAVFACSACGRRWRLAEVEGLDPEQREAIHFLPEACCAYVRCPTCGAADFEVVAGRGVGIERIEAEARP